MHTYLVPHDGQEVHAEVLYIHPPLPQCLGSIRVHKDSGQPGGDTALIQGLNTPSDLRNRLKWGEASS